MDRHGFRWRGGDVSRLEGFSDAVFALAVTLLIVSFESPSLAEMQAAMSSFVPFAATFAILVWIWYEHYVFFRRYALRDGTTILLNSLLLFLVLFYVYPLKFMFSFLASMLLGIGQEELGLTKITGAQARELLIVYGLGFFGVFLVFALLHAHALRRRDSLELSRAEEYATRSQIGGALGNVGIAAASVLVAWLAPPTWMAVAGLLYCAIGPYQGIWHYARARRAPGTGSPAAS